MLNNAADYSAQADLQDSLLPLLDNNTLATDTPPSNEVKVVEPSIADDNSKLVKNEEVISKTATDNNLLNQAQDNPTKTHDVDVNKNPDKSNATVNTEAKDETTIVEDEEDFKKNYEELRSYSDRKITTLIKERKELEKQLKEKPEPVNSKEYTELSQTNEKLLNDNKMFAEALTKIKEEYGLDSIDQFVTKQAPKPLSAEDIKAILDERDKSKAVLNTPKDNLDDDANEAKKDVLDFMSKKSLLKPDGTVGENGKKFLSILDSLNPPTHTGVALYEKLIEAKHKLGGSSSNQVKEAIAQTVASISSPAGTQGVQPKNDDSPLGDLLELRKFYNS